MKRPFLRILSIGFICFGLVLSVINDQISICSFSFLAMSVGTLGSVFSLFITNKYTLKFNSNNWIKNNDNSSNYKLLIEKRKHGMGENPAIKVFEYNKNNDNYEEVICGNTIDNGDVILSANSIFSGKVIIS